VKRLIYDTSAPVPDAPTGIAAVDVNVAAEAVARDASIPWTIIRPTIYLGNLMAQWSVPGIVQNRVIAYPLPPEIALSWISWEDTAIAVTRALTDPLLVGLPLDIGGYNAITGQELAAAFSVALNGEYIYAPIPLEGFEAGLNQVLGSPVGTEIAKLYGWLAVEGRKDLSRTTNDNARVGLQLIQPEDWIRAQNWAAISL
jgi:NAD(P)H dehydrogenase (quinone)